MLLYFCWLDVFWMRASFVLICSVTSLLVVWQNSTRSFISSTEKLFNFSYQLFTNCWSWFPIVGSSWMQRPFGMTFSSMHRDRKAMCASYLAFLSFNRSSLTTFGSSASMVLGDESGSSLVDSFDGEGPEIWMVGVSNSSRGLLLRWKSYVVLSKLILPERLLADLLLVTIL